MRAKKLWIVLVLILTGETRVQAAEAARVPGSAELAAGDWSFAHGEHNGRRRAVIAQSGEGPRPAYPFASASAITPAANAPAATSRRRRSPSPRTRPPRYAPSRMAISRAGAMWLTAPVRMASRMRM